MFKIVSSLVALWLAFGCVAPPGVVERTFAPVGTYGGHWGADFAMEAGSDVIVVADGIVSFAGTVAGMNTVTVDHGGGIRTSYSYLSSVDVAVGDEVRRGEILGTSGTDHGIPAIHVSARLNGSYVDPSFMFMCNRGTVRLSPIGS